MQDPIENSVFFKAMAHAQLENSRMTKMSSNNLEIIED